MQYLPDLVSTAWLAAHSGASDLRVLDATLFLPDSGKNGRTEYEREHIPGALFFDINAASDRASALPNMLPSASQFAAIASDLGIGNEDRVVIYDAQGIVSSPRAWWMFRMFGHATVAVLDGGLPKWRREGRAMETGTGFAPAGREFVTRAQLAEARSLAQVQAAIGASSEKIIDARSARRFAGAEPEPRPGLRSGHIPGSFNVPYATLIDHEMGTYLGHEELRAKFLEAGIDPEQPAICTCGSGISACVLAFALHQLGNRSVAVYDGSWSEWAADSRCPVASGAN